TTKPDQARAFYEDKLGLRFAGDDPFALVFDCAGTMLRIQKVERFEPAPFTALGWQVDDIGAAVADLEKRGLVFERYEFIQGTIWTSPGGARIAWLKDPDGNTLSLTQFP
ncbi:MAG TPA: VOC family protein, partial [Capsulimonadaceae bacterium]|nr:VOC family protein [Capsulimonadaceae bacterium]